MLFWFLKAYLVSLKTDFFNTILGSLSLYNRKFDCKVFGRYRGYTNIRLHLLLNAKEEEVRLRFIVRNLDT